MGDIREILGLGDLLGAEEGVDRVVDIREIWGISGRYWASVISSALRKGLTES